MTAILLIILILLGIADGVTTYLALKNPNAYEANKALAWLIDAVGLVPALALFKGIGIVAGVLIARYEAAPFFLVPLIALYAWGISKNVQAIRG